MKYRHLNVVYDFLDTQCIASKCWSPGPINEGQSMVGGRRTDSIVYCCTTRATGGGCPTDRGIDPVIEKSRKNEGWRPA